MAVYDAKTDEQFGRGYIDLDEMRTRVLDDGREIPFRFMHGGFAGTDVKFTFSFPPKEMYEGRFYQHLSPFPGPDEEMASIPVLGLDDKIGFSITHGAYFVECNMGSRAVFSNNEDATMTHRSNAAAAEYSRVKACEVYGYEHRPYGYAFGGSGGGYRTMACIENTNAFDGAVPFVIGSPYAIPNCQTTRAHAERLLRHKIHQVVDAVDAGGSGDPYEGLDEDEAAALKEATLFGYPLKSWFASEDLNDGALPVLYPGVKAMDPQYFEDFWKVPGYLGADPEGTAVRDRICMDGRVIATSVMALAQEANEKEASLQEGADTASGNIDTRNGVDNAWKKMIGNESESMEPWIELTDTPRGDDLYLGGAKAFFVTGKASGRSLQIGKIEGHRVYFTDGYETSPIRETLELAEEGDQVHLDNSDYIAIQTYHRHQVPTPDYKSWDQFRDSEGNPLYPQQKVLVGPVFSSHGCGCRQCGEIQGKIIIVACLMDEQAYPWQADWYRRKVRSVRGGDDADYLRLWYFDNALHGDTSDSINELRVTTYVAGLNQALVDLAAWVEKGIAPLPSSNYTVDIGHVMVEDSAIERAGIQPVPTLLANGEKCAHVKAGEEVRFTVNAQVPAGAGRLTHLAFSFEGEQDFPVKGQWELSADGSSGSAGAVHTYDRPGTYFGVVRVMSERTGDMSQIYTQIRNIDRVRVVVE